MRNTNLILRTYAVIAALTLIFQIIVRVQQCAHTGGCAISFAKGFAWSVIWPAAWGVYLKEGALTHHPVIPTAPARPQTGRGFSFAGAARILLWPWTRITC